VTGATLVRPVGGDAIPSLKLPGSRIDYDSDIDFDFDTDTGSDSVKSGE
jgi:hypothetical protein